MHLLKSRPTWLYCSFLLILAIAIASSAAALADSPSSTAVKATVNGNGLNESGPTSVVATPLTLNGTDQTTIFTLPITVEDFTGTGTGWHLTISSTQFSNTAAPTLLKLGTDASHVTGVTAVCNGGTCTDPTNTVSYPVKVPITTSTPSTVSFFQAIATTGMGGFTVTPTISVKTLANIFAGDYTSTFTITLISGP